MCLTFTKAAAAEMAVRLQKTLGRWVTMSPDALAKALQDLHVEPTDAACATARALFAHVLDLPGGMRIGTIHAFSQSLLRRFPLEASISPHFQLVEDRDADDALTEARETMLANATSTAALQALRTLAGMTTADQFGMHVKTLQSDRQRLGHALRLNEDLERAQRRALGVTAADPLADAVSWLGEAALRDAVRAVLKDGPPTAKEKAAAILDWLSQDATQRQRNWSNWPALFLTVKGEPCAASTLVGQKLSKQKPELADRYLEEAARVLRIEDARRAVRLAAVSNALALLAGRLPAPTPRARTRLGCSTTPT